jgi:hypothetical protein
MLARDVRESKGRGHVCRGTSGRGAAQRARALQPKDVRASESSKSRIVACAAVGELQLLQLPTSRCASLVYPLRSRSSLSATASKYLRREHLRDGTALGIAPLAGVHGWLAPRLSAWTATAACAQAHDARRPSSGCVTRRVLYLL